MEHRGVLTGDPLRFDGAGLGGGALRRLDAASTRIAALEGAARGLAALTRVRLADLTSPSRGDTALAEVLARLVRAGADDRGLDAPAQRRLGAPVSLTQPARVVPVSVARPEQSAVRVSGGVESNGRGRRFAPLTPLASRRLTQASVSEWQPGRAFVPASAAEAPDAPRGFDVVQGVRGLEWLVVRVTGGAESSETPLVEGAPEISSGRPVLAAAAEPMTVTRALPVPDHSAPVPHDVERAPETPSAVPPVTRRASYDTPRRRAGAQGLDTLVRAWQDAETPPSPERDELPAELRAPATANGGFASPRNGGASRSRAAETRASEREEETLVFGDALGRVLVAELRRYGIEVEAG